MEKVRVHLLNNWSLRVLIGCPLIFQGLKSLLFFTRVTGGRGYCHALKATAILAIGKSGCLFANNHVKITAKHEESNRGELSEAFWQAKSHFLETRIVHNYKTQRKSEL